MDCLQAMSERRLLSNVAFCQQDEATAVARNDWNPQDWAVVRPC